MANTVDKLFDETLPQLDPTSSQIVADWPDFPFDDDLESRLPDEIEEDGVRPYRDDELAVRTADVLVGGQPGVSPVSEENQTLIEGGIRARGFDALAFYKSRRFQAKKPFPGKWGIFYLRPGLSQIAWEIATAYPGYKDPRKLAHEFLFAHEHFHFRADLQTLMFEAVTKKHLYLPLRNALKGRQSHFIEEALANRQVYEWSKKTSIGLREYATDFMLLQPNAYARFNEPVQELSGEWAANVLDLQPPGCLPRYDLASWINATPKDLLRKSLCPQYVVYPRKLSNWISPAWVPPPVNTIMDGDRLKKLLASKYKSVSSKWESTKLKLIENRMLRGLNFKKWPKEGNGVYSVRIDDNFRAHLRHEGHGAWIAYVVGPHKKMGHG